MAYRHGALPTRGFGKAVAATSAAIASATKSIREAVEEAIKIDWDPIGEDRRQKIERTRLEKP